MSESSKEPVELRSEEVQEIVSYVPHWIIRWGITVFFFIMILLLLISWFVHYPDIIKAPFRLTSLNAPKSVICKTDGKLIRLFVEEDDLVMQNDVLAYLESTANHDDVLSLSMELDSLEQTLRGQKTIKLFNNKSFGRLGELQLAYQTFDLAYTEYLSFQTDGFYLAKRELLNKELRDLTEMESILKDQKKIYQQDWELAIEEYDVQKKLEAEKVIARLEFKKEQSRLLNRQLPLKLAESSLISNKTNQKAKLKDLLELNKLISEQDGIFLQSLNSLRSAVEAWKNKYVLTAPVDGRIFFARVVEERQSLNINQEIFFVAPETTSHYGEVFIPQYNLGKVKVGQDVLIKFNGYPFQEFGLVKGKITFMSEMPLRDSSFLAKVEMPNGLVTNHGKKLVYRTGMKATAEVITADSRMAEKIFYNFRKALSTH